MTTIYADVRVYRFPDHNYWTLSIEVPAVDLAGAVLMLNAWSAGLHIESQLDTVHIESLTTSKRRGVEYHTLREAAVHLRNNHFTN